MLYGKLLWAGQLLDASISLVTLYLCIFYVISNVINCTFCLSVATLVFEDNLTNLFSVTYKLKHRFFILYSFVKTQNVCRPARFAMNYFYVSAVQVFYIQRVN